MPSLLAARMLRGRFGTYAKLVDDRNESAHPNGNIFYSTEAALDVKITEILRVVGEIQTHSQPVIEHCYREFLLQNHDPDEREYPDAADQIREVLIHGNYLSQKDIEICLCFDVESRLPTVQKSTRCGNCMRPSLRSTRVKMRTARHNE